MQYVLRVRNDTGDTYLSHIAYSTQAIVAMAREFILLGDTPGACYKRENSQQDWQYIGYLGR